jgi:hypothetical protein
MNTTKEEKTYKELLKNKTWKYLNDNFHKFSQSNKIKVALAICTKDMPTEITGAEGASLIPPSIIFEAVAKK